MSMVMVYHLRRVVVSKLKSAMSVYRIKKSSTTRVNKTELVLCLKRPGVIEVCLKFSSARHRRR